MVHNCFCKIRRVTPYIIILLLVMSGCRAATASSEADVVNVPAITESIDGTSQSNDVAGESKNSDGASQSNAVNASAETGTDAPACADGAVADAPGTFITPPASDSAGSPYETNPTKQITAPPATTHTGTTPPQTTEPLPSLSTSLSTSPSPSTSKQQTPGSIITPSPTVSASSTEGVQAPAGQQNPVSETDGKQQVVFSQPVYSFDSKTQLCLTFDDGGDKKSVKKALEILERNNIQCTFFVIGKYLKSNSDLWKQAIEQGHQICNHTQNHPWLGSLSSEKVKQEILEWEATAAEILGDEYIDSMKKEFPYFRLPGNSGYKSKKIMSIISDLGYIPIGWNIETYSSVLKHYDYKNEPLTEISDKVSKHVIQKAKGGSIILLHFNPYDTHKLEETLTGLKEKGLSIQLLSSQAF